MHSQILDSRGETYRVCKFQNIGVPKKNIQNVILFKKTLVRTQKMALNTLCLDILWNLEILKSLEPNNTLLVIGDRLSFDNHRFQSIRRTWSGNSRSQIIGAINKTINLLDELLVSYQYCVYLQPQLPFPTKHSQEQTDITEKIHDNLKAIFDKQDGVNQGLETIKKFERYTNDIAFIIDIDNAKASLQKLMGKCQALTLRAKQSLRRGSDF